MSLQSLQLRRLQRLLAKDGFVRGATRPRGTPIIAVQSYDEASCLRPTRNAVVVAIRAPGTPPRSLMAGWQDVLHVEIEDVNFRGDLTPGVDLAPAASAIADFILRYRGVRKIVLHCHAGVNRSRSTAAAVCTAMGWTHYRWTVLHEPLHRAVLAAFRERQW